jgi:sugar fermentation stimulation protein A
MKYGKIVKGKFISRPNRFIAHVEIEGKKTVVHVKNTGRCRELLISGASVYLEKSTNPERKTPYDLVTVEKKTPRGNFLVNMDSQAPNKIAGEWILGNKERFPEVTFLKPEFTYGISRFDFYIEYRGVGKTKAAQKKIHKMFLEVKGVTLEQDGLASFPDAPTERGIKHLTELTKILAEKRTADDGTPYECGVLFLIQMKGCTSFGPDDRIHPEFGAALRGAKKAGVEVFVVDCQVTPKSVVAESLVPLVL